MIIDQVINRSIKLPSSWFSTPQELFSFESRLARKYLKLLKVLMNRPKYRSIMRYRSTNNDKYLAIRSKLSTRLGFSIDNDNLYTDLDIITQHDRLIITYSASSRISGKATLSVARDIEVSHKLGMHRIAWNQLIRSLPREYLYYKLSKSRSRRKL